MRLSTASAVSDVVDDVLATGAELGVVVAFGKLIKPHVLDAIAMVNVHFSLLPRWRGAAPVERAILAGDTETGVCLMRVDVGLDTGDVFRERRFPIDDEISAAALTAELATIGAELLIEGLRDGLGEGVAQEGEATYAAKITPDELALDLSQPPIELAARNPAWSGLDDGERQAPDHLAAPTVVDGQPRADGSATGRQRPHERDRLGARRRRLRVGLVNNNDLAARHVARDALGRIENDNAYANLVLGGLLERSGLDDRDKRFVTELVYGSTRMRRAVDAALAPHLQREVDPGVRTILRLGTYQLLFANVAVARGRQHQRVSCAQTCTRLRQRRSFAASPRPARLEHATPRRACRIPTGS